MCVGVQGIILWLLIIYVYVLFLMVQAMGIDVCKNISHSGGRLAWFLVSYSFWVKDYHNRSMLTCDKVQTHTCRLV